VIRKVWYSLIAGIAALALVGCGNLPRNPVPVDQIDNAQVPGMPAVRTWGGKVSDHFQRDFVQSIHDEKGLDYVEHEDGTRGYMALAVSGGGASGAFGAGFVNGWTDAGDRPVFKLVTGISAGALVAPFAYLGAEYDQQLKEAFTTISDENVFRLSIDAEAMTDTAPLFELISRYVDTAFLEAVAVAHTEGRRLYIGTTNLDAQNLVVWNMGAIASQGGPQALDLFRKVMLASSSIPIAFPPVLIDVESDGQVYDEMHVDGGVVTQVFFYGFTLDLDAAVRDANPDIPRTKGRVYMLRNDSLRSRPSETKRKLIDITDRTINSMIRSMSWGDLYRVYAITREREMDFNFAVIPADFKWQGEEMFDQEEMNRLFELGYQLAKNGYAWQKAPPGFD
jgi:predicted acylesterase/phospholipase RssA